MPGSAQIYGGLSVGVASVRAVLWGLQGSALCQAFEAGRVRVQVPIILEVDSKSAIENDVVIMRAGHVVFVARGIPHSYLTRLENIPPEVIVDYDEKHPPQQDEDEEGPPEEEREAQEGQEVPEEEGQPSPSVPEESETEPEDQEVCELPEPGEEPDC